MKTLILGMGNTILCDDAVGIIIKRYLEEKLINITDLDFYETSWGGFRIIDLLEGYDYAIVIDAIKTGQKSEGEIHHLTSLDLLPTLRLNSYHDINFITAIKLAEKLRIKVPSNIEIFAVEVEDNYTIVENLNTVIRKSIPVCSQRIVEYMVLKGLINIGIEDIVFNEILTNDELQKYYFENFETEKK